MPLVPLLHGHAAIPPTGPWCQEPSATRGVSPLATTALDRVPGAPYIPGVCASSGVPTFLELESGGYVELESGGYVELEAMSSGGGIPTFLELEGGGFLDLELGVPLELEGATFASSVQFRPR